MQLTRRVLNMFAIVMLFGLTLLASLAASDLLISALTTDELNSMGLRPD